MKHNGGRARKLLPKLLLIILGILVGAGVAEVALRVAGYSYLEFYTDRKSTRLNSSHIQKSRMPSSA